MSMYSFVLCLHIMGAVVLFAGLGIEGIVYTNLNNASTSRQVLAWGSSMKAIRIVFAASVLLLLIPGVYLVFESWGWNSWVITGLVLLVGLSGYGSTTGKKIITAMKSLNPNEESLPDDYKKSIDGLALMKSYKIKITLALGIIFIMTIKPGWVGSIVTIVAASAIGLLLNLPFGIKETAKELESA